MLPNSKTTAAGALNEDIFFAAFEDVPLVDISSSKDLVFEMQEINTVLSDPSNDWDKRNDALRKIRSLVNSGAGDYEDFFVELRALEVPFQLAIKDLRSQVVREACITIGYLSYKLGTKLDHFTETVFHALMNLIKCSTKVMSTSALVACRFIVKYTHAVKLIPIITSNLNSKSKEIRRAACELLWLILRECSPSILDKNVPSLQNSIRQGLFDADAEARSLARKAYWVFAEHFKESADQLFQSLDATKQRQLRGELSQSSSSSSLASQAFSVAQPKPVIAAATSALAAFRTRASQENVFAAGSRMPRPVAGGPALLPRGMPAGRSTSDIDAGAVKRAVQRHGGAGATILVNASRPAVVAATRSNWQHLNSLPRSSTISAHSCRTLVSAVSSYCSPVAEERSSYRTPPRRTLSKSVSQPGSRSNSPSRIAVPSGSSSGRKNSRPPLVIAPQTFPSLSRETSPNRTARRSSETTRTHNFGAADSNSSILADFEMHTPAKSRWSREKSEDGFVDLASGGDASSVCSPGVSVGTATPPLDWEVQEALKRCSSAQLNERKEALQLLQRHFRSGRRLTKLEFKRVCEMFMRMLVDAQHKAFTAYLDALNDFIVAYHCELHELLYFLTVRLLTRVGAEPLSSVQTKLTRTLDVVRDHFPARLQFTSVVRYLNDATQTPGVKVKLALLKYFNDVVHLSSAADLTNTTDLRQAVFKLIQWAADSRNIELRRPAQLVLSLLFSLNAPEFNAIISTFAKNTQDIVHKLLQSHLQKQNDSNQGDGCVASAKKIGSVWCRATLYRPGLCLS